MSDPVPHVAVVVVRSVVAVRQPLLIEILENFHSCHVEKWPDEAPIILKGNRRKAIDSSSTEQFEEEGFCLIVPGVTNGNLSSSCFLSHTFKKAIAALPEGFLEGKTKALSIAWNILGKGVEGKVESFGNIPNEVRIFPCFWSQLVVKMSDGEGGFRRHEWEDVEESHRIRST